MLDQNIVMSKIHPFSALLGLDVQGGNSFLKNSINGYFIIVFTGAFG